MSVTSAQQITGGTIRLAIEWVNWAGVDTDPDPGSSSLTIIDSHGVVQATLEESDLTRDDVGKWHYDYETPAVTADEVFLAQWEGDVNGEPDRPRYYFTVEA